jgi:hypothetical protein
MEFDTSAATRGAAARTAGTGTLAIGEGAAPIFGRTIMDDPSHCHAGPGGCDGIA